MCMWMWMNVHCTLAPKCRTLLCQHSIPLFFQYNSAHKWQGRPTCAVNYLFFLWESDKSPCWMYPFLCLYVSGQCAAQPKLSDLKVLCHAAVGMWWGVRRAWDYRSWSWQRQPRWASRGKRSTDGCSDIPSRLAIDLGLLWWHGADACTLQKTYPNSAHHSKSSPALTKWCKRQLIGSGRETVCYSSEGKKGAHGEYIRKKP